MSSSAAGGTLISSGGATIAKPLRLDSVYNTPLSGVLEGRTPLDLLSDVLDLGENITAGLLAQAIIGHVLRGLGTKLMSTYHSWDLEIPHGASTVRVEIKTCSTTQAWRTASAEPKAWGCGPIASVWDAEHVAFVRRPQHRPAHLYIFVRRDGDVFDAASYTALTISTTELEALLDSPSRKEISRARLLRDHSFVSLNELPAVVTTAMGRLAREAAASVGL